MKLVVEILTGTLFFVEVDNNATIGDLKREIGTQQNLPTDRLILVIGQDPTASEDDGASLVDYGVQDGSHIYLFFKPLSSEEGSGSDKDKDKDKDNDMDNADKEKETEQEEKQEQEQEQEQEEQEQDNDNDDKSP